MESSFLNTELDIARLLHERKSYRQIASQLKVSPKTISAVKKKIKAGVIRVDEDGKARYVRGKSFSMVEKPEWEASPLLVHLMRVLGCRSPEEALKIANEFAVRLNPYILYYNVKTPAQLIDYFENKVKELKGDVERLWNRDENALATQLGINSILMQVSYQIAKQLGYQGTLGDFLNTCIVTFLQALAKMIGANPEDFLRDIKVALSNYVDLEFKPLRLDFLNNYF